MELSIQERMTLVDALDLQVKTLERFAGKAIPAVADIYKAEIRRVKILQEKVSNNETKPR